MVVSSTVEGWGAVGVLGQPSLLEEETLTLQERDLDVLAVHGDPSPMLQLHEVAVRVGQADSD